MDAHINTSKDVLTYVVDNDTVLGVIHGEDTVVLSVGLISIQIGNLTAVSRVVQKVPNCVKYSVLVAPKMENILLSVEKRKLSDIRVVLLCVLDKPLELVEDVVASRHPFGANLVVGEDMDVLLYETNAEQELLHISSVIDTSY